MKAFVVAAMSAALLMAAVGTAVVASAVSLFGGGGPAIGPAAARIPPAMLSLYEEAAPTCIGLPWTVLAAIGTVESDNGQSNLPGVHSGANAAGAEGAETCRKGDQPPRGSFLPAVAALRAHAVPAPASRFGLHLR